MIIKVLLIAGAIGFGFLVIRDSVPGHNVVRRIGGIAVVILGIVAVLWPTLTTYLANAVGVGRGTDLVLYVLVMVFLYSAVATAQRIHRLEHQLTMLTRELAIDSARLPAGERKALNTTGPEAGSGAKVDG